mgnify:CR=1 FL=1
MCRFNEGPQLQAARFPEACIIAGDALDDEMIHEVEADDLAGLFQARRRVNILLGRVGRAARVVVGHDDGNGVEHESLADDIPG